MEEEELCDCLSVLLVCVFIYIVRKLRSSALSDKHKYTDLISPTYLLVEKSCLSNFLGKKNLGQQSIKAALNASLLYFTNV